METKQYVLSYQYVEVDVIICFRLIICKYLVFIYSILYFFIRIETTIKPLNCFLVYAFRDNSTISNNIFFVINSAFFKHPVTSRTLQSCLIL